MVHADLHVHTRASDGSMEPEEALELAKKIGLKALSFTDHESLCGYYRAHNYARGLGLDLLPGIEMVTSHLGYEIHLLGYNFDPYSKELTSKLQVIRKERNELARQVIDRLQNLGFKISWAQAEKLIPSGGVLGKNHILYLMRQAGYIKNTEQTIRFLRQYLNSGGLAYIPYDGNPLSLAVSVIHNAGGFAVLAHPGLIGNDGIVNSIIDEGIDGLEVFYFYLGKNRGLHIRNYFKLARERRLLITGGTDFHGIYTPVEIGAMGISLTHLEKLNNYERGYSQACPLKEVPTLT